MEHKETLIGMRYHIIAEIYKFDNCNLYFISFWSNKHGKETHITVKIRMKYLKYDYGVIKEEIKRILFRKVSNSIHNKIRHIQILSNSALNKYNNV